MAFDPNQPFTVNSAPGFDPSKPFDITRPKAPSLGEAMATGMTAEAFGTPSTSAAVAQGAVLDPPEAVMQMVGAPIPGPLQRFREVAKTDPSGAGEMLGSAIGPLNWYMPELRLAKPALRIAAAAGRGGATSALQPVDDDTKDFWGAKGEQFGSGAAIGGGFGSLGELIGKKVGALEELLMRQGIRLPWGGFMPGQKGYAEAAGHVFPTSIPIARGRTQSLDDFNRWGYNVILGPLRKVDPSVTVPQEVGNKGMAKVFDQITDRLNTVLPRLTLPQTPVFRYDMDRIVSDAKPNILSQSAKDQLDVVRNNIDNQMRMHSGVMDGTMLKNAVSDLRTMARRITRGTNITSDQWELHDAYEAFADKLIEHSNGSPKDLAMRDAASNSYAIYKSMEPAAAGTTAAGMFTPESVLAARKSRFRESRFVQGRAPEQGFAQSAYDLGIGPPPRAQWWPSAAALGSTIPTGGLSALLGIPSLGYEPWVQSALSKLALSAARQRAPQAAARLAAPTAAVAGQAVGDNQEDNQ